MKAIYKESEIRGEEPFPRDDTAQLRIALEHANERIRELEESISALRSEVDEKQRKRRSLVDFSWLAMA